MRINESCGGYLTEKLEVWYLSPAALHLTAPRGCCLFHSKDCIYKIFQSDQLDKCPKWPLICSVDAFLMINSSKSLTLWTHSILLWLAFFIVKVSGHGRSGRTISSPECCTTLESLLIVFSYLMSYLSVRRHQSLSSLTKTTNIFIVGTQCCKTC